MSRSDYKEKKNKKKLELEYDDGSRDELGPFLWYLSGINTLRVYDWAKLIGNNVENLNEITN